MSELKLYDKVVYTGENPVYKKHIWTVSEIDTTNAKPIYKLAYTKNFINTVWRSDNPDLFMVAYNGAPKFAVGQPDISFIDVDRFQPVRIISVFASYNEAPNAYGVIRGEDYSSDSVEMPESSLFVFNPISGSKDSSTTTLKHIALVSKFINEFAIDMIMRGDRHDASKFSFPEKDLLDRMEFITATEGQVPYGSKEYIERAKMLKPMLKSHFAKNSHHPEYHPNGIYGMTLMDLVEMFCDWRAAAIRGGDNAVGVTHAADRFLMSDQLKRIFENTYEQLGVSVK